MICTRCLEDKPEEEFHIDRRAKDGKSSHCKVCQSLAHRESYKKYRAKNLARAKEYSQTQAGKAASAKATHNQNERSPEKVKARNMVRCALRSGKLIRLPCEVCGEIKVEAHHEDYSKPLEVRWLCNYHHRETEGRLI